MFTMFTQSFFKRTQMFCSHTPPPPPPPPPTPPIIQKIVLLEKDLVFKFVKGSGPGGQAVNKTSNCVQLTHLPTGLTVYSHESRTCETNKQYAKKKMKIKLDEHFNQDLSKHKVKQAKKAKSKANKHNKSHNKHLAIKEEKEEVKKEQAEKEQHQSDYEENVMKIINKLKNKQK